MTQQSRTPWQSHLFAVGVTGAALLVHLTSSEWLSGYAPYLPFIAAVVLAAWLGGLGPGLLATALGAVAEALLPSPPGSQIGAGRLLPLVLFIGIGMLTSWLSDSLHAARRQLAAKEQESTRRLLELQAILESTPAIVYLMDAENCFLHINRRWQAVFGLTNERVAGRSIYDFFPAPIADQFRENNRKVLDAGSAVQLEEVVPQDDGPHTYITVKVPIFDATGAPYAICGISTDITERKRVEREREQALATLRSLIGSAPVGIALLDAEMRFVLVNDPLAEMNGVPASEHIGRTVAEIVPDVVAAVEAAFRNVLKTAQPIKDMLVEGETAKAPGVRRAWVESWFPVYGSFDGKPSGVGVVVQETTDQLRAERQLRESRERLMAALAASDTGTFRWDPSTGTFLEFGENLQRLFGLEPDQTIRATEDFVARVHPDDQPKLLAAIERSRHGAGFEMEYRVVLPGGGIRWLYDRAKMIRDAEGRPVYLVGACTDITKRRQVEEALKDADRKKDEFLAILAHELRNHLAPLRNGLQVIHLAGGIEATRERTLTMMDRQVSQMVRLLDDLLDVSRITSGRLELRKEWLELATVVEAAVETSRPIIEALSHTLTVELPPVMIPVNADRTRLAQVFSNLLTNAAKYTEPGGDIRLMAEQQDDEVVITVQDSGVGIPADMLPRVFEMFTQVNRSLERSQGGLGIGLTLAKRLVEMHGGSIEAKSEGEGKGSAFTIRLPTAVAPSPPGIAQDVEGRRETLPKRRIVVADDNEDSTSSLAQWLELKGNEVRTAKDGLEAVAVAEAFHPDLVLLDIGMPKLNGYDAARRIREQPWSRGVVLIALTGLGQEEDRRRAMESGFDHHLVKPVDPAVLEKLLAQPPTELAQGKGSQGSANSYTSLAPSE